MNSPNWTRYAAVPTPRAARYAKQLASHLGTRCATVETPDGYTVSFGPEFGVGDCLIHPAAEALELTVTAEAEADLGVIADIVGSHLQEFGRRDGLTVHWQ